MASKKKDWTDTEAPIKVVHPSVDFKARKPELAQDTFMQAPSWKDEVRDTPVAKAYEKSREDTAANKYGKSQAQLVHERQEAIKQYAPGLVKGIRAAENVEKEHPVAIRAIPAVGISDFVNNGLGKAGAAAVKAGVQDNPVSPVGHYMRSRGGKMALTNLSDKAQYEYDYDKQLSEEQRRFEAADAAAHPAEASMVREPISIERDALESVDLDTVKVTKEDRARAKEAAKRSLK